jgi:hypothetical protein
VKVRKHLLLCGTFLLPVFILGISLNVKAEETGGLSGYFGAGYMTNPNISLILDTRVYASNLSNDELAARGIPGYTASGLEMIKGFNFDSAELGFFSPVDPFFNLYANIPFTAAGVNVEEAYVVSTELPAGLQAKIGRFKSNITRLDAMHPHAWDFTDIALPYRAFLGTEGLGGENGVQLTYLPALPFYLLLGAEIFQGENSLVLSGQGWNGPQAYTGFIKTSVETGDLSTLYFGPWVLTGQTSTNQVVLGEVLTGRSTLSGLEAVWKWNPYAGIAFILQGEYMYLHQEGGLSAADGFSAALLRKQDGAYLQAVYQWYEYHFGVRYDRLALGADQFDENAVQQDLGNFPRRATVNCTYVPDHFTNIRLQYTYDDAARNGQINREIMLQFIFTIGAHPAHTF